MAGTTIDGLNSVTSLTAQDEVPVWDAEASGEPTKKITASNLAASVKTLGSLVNTTEMNNALAGKQNTLTFDTTPTTSSTNPVTSGGIATAISQSTASIDEKITPRTFTSTTLASIASTLNGLYGANYCIPFVLYDSTDGSPNGYYIAMRNNTLSSSTKFLYYNAPSNSYIDVTKLNKLQFTTSVSGGAVVQKLELVAGSGGAGESEIRLYVSSAGYYVLNMSTAGLKYGYDDGAGHRNYYKQLS